MIAVSIERGTEMSVTHVTFRKQPILSRKKRTQSATAATGIYLRATQTNNGSTLTTAAVSLNLKHLHPFNRHAFVGSSAAHRAAASKAVSCVSR